MKFNRIVTAALAALFFINTTPLRAQETAQQDFQEVSLNLVSDYAYVYDYETGQVLYEKGENGQIYPASLTKMMTAIVAMEKVENPLQTISITQEMLDGLVEANASVVGYQVGQTLTLTDLLYGALLPSGADSCNALVAISYGTLDAFVEAMNEKAAELGMVNSHFSNATGLHDDNLYSTCKDMAILTQYCLQNETFKEVFFSKTYTDSQENYMWATVQPYFEWNSYNLPGFLGDKTGYTDEAGHCMASYSEINGMKIITVTAHAMTDIYSDEHITDAAAISTWLYDTYERANILQEGDYLASYTAKEIIGEMACDIYSEITLDADIRKGIAVSIVTDQEDSYLARNEDQTKYLTISIEQDDQVVRSEMQSFIVPKTDDFFNRFLIFFRDLF